MLEPIAQELAKSISEVIGYDVLITDVKGVIIGCSDPDRGFGTLNESSRIAAETGRGSVDTEELSQRLRGTRPGVTYPMVGPDGRVIGTVAITGDPEKVTPFALVVKRQAELYLRERIMQREVMERERNLQALVSDVFLLNSKVSDPELLLNRAEHFGYDRSSEYVALSVETVRSRDSNGGGVYRDPVLARLRDAMGGPRSLMAAMKMDLYVVFLPLSGKLGAGLSERIGEIWNGVRKSLSSMGIESAVGIGSGAMGIEELARSCREARLALRIGRKVAPGVRFYPIKDYRVEELLFFSPRSLTESMSERELSPLEGRGDTEELRDTLTAWCESGFNVAEASRSLHLHRSTVNYRLEKLASIFHVDVRDFREMSQLYWAISLDKLNRGRPRKTLEEGSPRSS
ncbi:MAG: sugar diacid recognition domain-containing protein [Synergistota bacterium]|nr:sugar diacid recognition domain-containing protein [Synergistota bacterium]